MSGQEKKQQRIYDLFKTPKQSQKKKKSEIIGVSLSNVYKAKKNFVIEK